MTDKMRKNFEAAIRLNHASRANFSTNENGHYTTPGLQLMFQGYQLARQSAVASARTTTEQDEAWIEALTDVMRLAGITLSGVNADPGWRESYDKVREYLRGRKP